MPYKNKLTQKESQRRYYQENKQAYLEVQRQRRQNLRIWYREYKRKLKCKRCGENHPACLTFHHTNPAEKTMDVARAVSTYRSIKKILEEINKCEVLCCNCHAKEHWIDE